MPEYIATVQIMPLSAILDPQGKAVGLGLAQIGVQGVGDVRVGKAITLQMQAENEEAARSAVELACQKLLANPIMEQYTYALQSLA